MRLTTVFQEWPYRQVFRISRSARETSEMFVAYVTDGGHVGRGECGLLPQYGHTIDDLVAGFEQARAMLQGGAGYEEIDAAIANSSVRNAIDCALLDLECKQQSISIWTRLGVAATAAIEVDLTIGINALDKMREDAASAVAQGYTILKVKADAEQTIEKVSAIASVAEGLRLIVDANEAWTIELLHAICDDLHRLGVVLIEQPLPHTNDKALAGYRGPVPLCADESCNDRSDLDVLAARYQSINIKLDKVGGLRRGLAMAHAAKARGMGLMLGCNGPTSLGLAPSYVLGALSDFNDLDGPALLGDDRADAMKYANGHLQCFTPALWG